MSYRLTLPYTLPLQVAYYEYIGMFLISGVVKIFLPNELRKEFPVFPSWFWTVCGVWEQAIAFLYLAEKTEYSLYMAYIFLGGAFFATIFTKGRTGREKVIETYGGLLIPSVLTLFSACTLADTVSRKINDVAVPLLLLGMAIGLVVSKSN